jgi:hypothetical protein
LAAVSTAPEKRFNRQPQGAKLGAVGVVVASPLATAGPCSPHLLGGTRARASDQHQKGHS